MKVHVQQCARLEEASAQVGKYTVYRASVDMGDPEDWKCTCPSFKFGRGLDERGYCKHIRQYFVEERCTWHEIYGVPQSDWQRDSNICPECGGPTVRRSVGI